MLAKNDDFQNFKRKREKEREIERRGERKQFIEYIFNYLVYPGHLAMVRYNSKKLIERGEGDGENVSDKQPLLMIEDEPYEEQVQFE